MISEKNKASRLDVRTSPEEAAMLQDLAAYRGVKPSEVVRSLIRDAYRSTFPMKNAGAEIPTTPRAILEAVTGVAYAGHLTLKNIAARADVTPSAIRNIFQRIEAPSFFERITTHQDGDETWQSWVPLGELLAKAEQKGVAIDAAIERSVLSFEVYVRDRAKGVIGIGPIGPSTQRLMSGLTDDLRAVCKKLLAEHQGKPVSATEMAGSFGALLAPRLGRGVDAYASPGPIHQVKKMASIFIDEG